MVSSFSDNEKNYERKGLFTGDIDFWSADLPLAGLAFGFAGFPSFYFSRTPFWHFGANIIFFDNRASFSTFALFRLLDL